MTWLTASPCNMCRKKPGFIVRMLFPLGGPMPPYYLFCDEHMPLDLKLRCALEEL